MENCETPRAAAAVATPSPCGAERGRAGRGGQPQPGQAGQRDGAVRCGRRDGTGQDRMEQDGMGCTETGRCGLRDGAVRAAGGGSAAFRPCHAWRDAAKL